MYLGIFLNTVETHAAIILVQLGIYYTILGYCIYTAPN